MRCACPARATGLPAALPGMSALVPEAGSQGSRTPPRHPTPPAGPPPMSTAPLGDRLPPGRGWKTGREEGQRGGRGWDFPRPGGGGFLFRAGNECGVRSSSLSPRPPGGAPLGPAESGTAPAAPWHRGAPGHDRGTRRAADTCGVRCSALASFALLVLLRGFRGSPVRAGPVPEAGTTESAGTLQKPREREDGCNQLPQNTDRQGPK